MAIREGTATVGDVDLFYDEFGSPDDPAVLLIMGLGAQMVLWRTEFCEQIAAAGYRVIRFDNRDSGLSTKFDGARSGGGPLPLKLLKFFVGLPAAGSAYTLTDLANDAAGVLDHLGIDRAHIVGASMGGMIAQVFAADHADRTLSATVIMSSNNRAFLPPPGPRQLLALLSPPPKGAGREEIIANSVAVSGVIGSPVYPPAAETALARATEYFDRCYYPIGVARQFAAILASGSLVGHDELIGARTLVLHGTHDKLMRASGARAVARSVSDARLVMVDGMAHDLPEPLWDRIIGELTRHFAAS
ncbi:pimeloyl-ACP methyl ester carboxylesterase [Gordonia humi]|uniref:Pimeloyl-ACP methyl ester carboxylesterase n=1 Tax=Gordonia humi TaxID=686429 RepID=A0A840F274_9ACTN|nr:alpha/beta hydrolase [Gordonia humi]MBB4136714.1 pimeloyl-ACP methyl ester carboxylesterase [Gordonia humi]